MVDLERINIFGVYDDVDPNNHIDYLETLTLGKSPIYHYVSKDVFKILVQHNNHNNHENKEIEGSEGSEGTGRVDLFITSNIEMTSCFFNVIYVSNKGSTIQYKNIVNDEILPISDIKPSDIEIYLDYELNIFDSIKRANDLYIKNTKRKITLDMNKTNILVLCANDRSIKEQKYKKILKKISNNNNLINNNDNQEKENVYYVGFDISFESENKIRCDISNLSVNGKFNIVISEHCPFFVINKNIEKISSITINNGCLITPAYIIYYEEFFEKIFEDVYTLYIKK